MAHPLLRMDNADFATTMPIRIVEVGPRDGLQNVKTTVPTATKIALITRLQEAGLQSIELTSAVKPGAIPQLADHSRLLGSDEIQKLLRQPEPQSSSSSDAGSDLDPESNSGECSDDSLSERGEEREQGLRLPVLVPNLKGLETAMQHGVQEVAVFVSASEGFSRANTNCSIEQGLERARAVIEKAKSERIAVRGYISCIFTCPYSGPTPLSTVLHITSRLISYGCYEISLGDTLGTGTPSNVYTLLSYLHRNGIPMHLLAGHFHDTHGQALKNVWQAYQCGVTVFDSSVAGLGGCPYAPGAKGNVATEEVVRLFERAGVSTGVDLEKLEGVGAWIKEELRMLESSPSVQNKSSNHVRTEDNGAKNNEDATTTTSTTRAACTSTAKRKAHAALAGLHDVLSSCAVAVEDKVAGNRVRHDSLQGT